ncbi:hypothetical protein Rumeso_03297 [Rubellimicrobium mesophilum DSM 19309]|uniref:Uncharacterized protein n=1 Tax=Rubellimicrobium mesophilum DSM 19309 TaxID=442562 RepID=A0A017HLG5_9RHOB|nr:hypothetical protein [Rubellimicrobium mesophilum]EYD75201.1 hypothetical protein Rumeso_03297 [Rubellimicrobium mesophilum DSM 19309]
MPSSFAGTLMKQFDWSYDGMAWLREREQGGVDSEVVKGFDLRCTNIVRQESRQSDVIFYFTLDGMPAGVEVVSSDSWGHLAGDDLRNLTPWRGQRPN